MMGLMRRSIDAAQAPWYRRKRARMTHLGRTSWVGITMLAIVLGLLAPAAATTSTIATNADAFVNARQAGSNKGSSSELRIRNDFKYAYIRFDVPAVPAGESITSATLRVFATSRPICSGGAEVLRAQSDDWEERTITYNN